MASTLHEKSLTSIVHLIHVIIIIYSCSLHYDMCSGSFKSSSIPTLNFSCM